MLLEHQEKEIEWFSYRESKASSVSGDFSMKEGELENIILMFSSCNPFPRLDFRRPLEWNECGFIFPNSCW